MHDHILQTLKIYSTHAISFATLTGFGTPPSVSRNPYLVSRIAYRASRTHVYSTRLSFSRECPAPWWQCNNAGAWRHVMIIETPIEYKYDLFPSKCISLSAYQTRSHKPFSQSDLLIDSYTNTKLSDCTLFIEYTSPNTRSIIP